MTATKTNERPGTRAVLRHSGLSASKVRQVLDLIRGQDVDRAAEILIGTEREAANIIGKVLASAVANAAHNDFQNPDELYVSACYADEGTTAKRWRPRARGRATRIRKRSSHITIIVSRLPEERLELRRKRMEAVSAHRSRRVDASRRRADLSGRLSRRRASAAVAEAEAAAAAEAEEELTTGVIDAPELEVGEVDDVDDIDVGDDDVENDAEENEVDDFSDEGPAEVVDMDEEDDTATAQAEAEEKGE
ncbi:MAG: 50S ribosomal protein L22 [Acidimicrobiales bacterium]|jgi:large subunit ribosomal protein L22